MKKKPKTMKGRAKSTVSRCEHCRGWVSRSARSKHVCQTYTEEDLLSPIEEDPRQAWNRLRAYLISLGEQKVYCSPRAIMFSRRVCYLFVRPKRNRLELYLFLDRVLSSDRVHSVQSPSQNKHCHRIDLTHEDSVEQPLLGWLKEAFDLAS